MGKKFTCLPPPSLYLPSKGYRNPIAKGGCSPCSGLRPARGSAPAARLCNGNPYTLFTRSSEGGSERMGISTTTLPQNGTKNPNEGRHDPAPKRMIEYHRRARFSLRRTTVLKAIVRNSCQLMLYSWSSLHRLNLVLPHRCSLR